MKPFLRTIFILLLCLPAARMFSQDSTARNFNISFRSGFSYEYKLYQVPLNACFYWKNNEVYVGPQYAHLLPLAGNIMDADQYINEEAWGLNFGCRGYFTRTDQAMSGFAQLDFSYFRVNYLEHSLGSGNIPRQSPVLINTLSFGFDYTENFRLHLFGGLGFGSTLGWFLNFHSGSLVPTAFLGLEYKILE